MSSGSGFPISHPWILRQFDALFNSYAKRTGAKLEPIIPAIIFKLQDL